MVYLDPLVHLRLRGAEHLHSLGPRATAELLAEVGDRSGWVPAIITVLGEYEQHLTPQMLRAVGDGRFSRRGLRVVPR